MIKMKAQIVTGLTNQQASHKIPSNDISKFNKSKFLKRQFMQINKLKLLHSKLLKSQTSVSNLIFLYTYKHMNNSGSDLNLKHLE